VNTSEYVAFHAVCLMLEYVALWLQKELGVSRNISVQSMITWVDGYISLNAVGMFRSTEDLDGHIGILRNRECKSNHVIFLDMSV
jgi:hypothetical protein